MRADFVEEAGSTPISMLLLHNCISPVFNLLEVTQISLVVSIYLECDDPSKTKESYETQTCVQ